MKISNNNLTILLLLAIVASISGTWVSLTFMDSITGAATTTGTTSLTVNATIACSATDSTANLGILERGKNNNSEKKNDFLVIENTGNVPQNISGYSTESLFDSDAAPTRNWSMHCNATQSGTCRTVYRKINATQGTAETLVLNLVSAAATDELTAGVNATVPAQESSGAKSGTITFYCVSTS